MAESSASGGAAAGGLLLPEGAVPGGRRDAGGSGDSLRPCHRLLPLCGGGDPAGGGISPCGGGFRVGLCGTAVMKDGGEHRPADLSSAAVRIAREQRGIGRRWRPGCFGTGGIRTPALSPPAAQDHAAGDLVRCLSSRRHRQAGLGSPLIDERGEVAVMCPGEAPDGRGPRTDVLDACPQGLASPCMARGP